MPASSQLSKLSVRAKEAEQKATAARSKAKSDLAQDVQNARQSTEAEADRLQTAVEADSSRISSGWSEVQGTWHEHVARIRGDADAKRAKLDRTRAERAAENAEADAQIAIDYAYAAIQEAEYSTLDAILARMEADELSTKA
jgi:hypothetical protein